MKVYSGKSAAVAPPLRIYVGTTAIHFRAMKNGNIGNGVNLGKFIQTTLLESEYDYRLSRWLPTYRYCTYDEENSMAYLPRYTLDKLEMTLRYLGVPYELIQEEPYTPRMVKIPLKKNVAPRENQVEIIDFLSDPELNFQPVSAQTAAGKTFCAITASSKYGMVTMIVLGLLIPQWYKSLRQFTQLSTADIYVVQGFNTLKKLWDMFKEGYRPKVIIFATRTLLLYAQSKTDSYDDLPSYREFQHQFGIGVKIIDEVHLGFNTNVLIDLYSNIKHNIYLSATYGRSNYTGKRIFNTVFPPELVYGSQVRKKYTAIYSVSYSLGLGGTVEDKVRTLKGYNHARYENYVMRIKELKQDYMTRVIPTALTEFYLNRHQPQFKVLILCQTQKFAECIYRAITEYMTKYTFTDAKGKKHKRSIGLFFSGTTKQEELTKDIVVSTVKSCGTGMDLKGLICCINTVSFSSSVLSVQMVGRLREIPGEETVFVDLWCRDVPSHHRHIAARMNEYTKIAKRVATSEL